MPPLPSGRITSKSPRRWPALSMGVPRTLRVRWARAAPLPPERASLYPRTRRLQLFFTRIVRSPTVGALQGACPHADALVRQGKAKPDAMRDAMARRNEVGLLSSQSNRLHVGTSADDQGRTWRT